MATDQGTTDTGTCPWSLLGLSGYNNGVNGPTSPSGVTSWIVRGPYEQPIAQRYSMGSGYCSPRFPVL